MTALDFIARIADSLAWPLVVFALLIVLRRPIGALLSRGQLKRFKAPGVELEWQDLAVEKAVAETLKDVAAGELPEASETPLELVDVVRTTHDLLRRELRSILEVVEQSKLLDSLSASALAHVAGMYKLISTEAVRSIDGINVIYELATQPGSTTTPASAAAFVDLARKGLRVLQEERARRAAILRRLALGPPKQAE